MTSKLTKVEVEYTVSKRGAEHCRGCRHFQGGMSCAVVEGVILRHGWCKRWTATGLIEANRDDAPSS